MKLLQSLKWRYATKKFDPTKKVSSENIEQLKEAIRLAASSYGLQPYKVLIIEDSAIKAKLQPASFGQAQIVDASHLFIFCINREMTGKMIEDFTNLKAKTQQISLEKMQGYSNFLKQTFAQKTPANIKEWAARQAYIALGNMMAACGELEIDSCPMEGFVPPQYDAILDLEKKGLQSVVAMAVGYRSDADRNQFPPKVRKSVIDLFEVL